MEAPVSPEIVAIVVSSVGVVVTVGIALFSGLACVIRRIDAVDRKLTERIDGVAHEVVELKIAVARLEGPRQRLIVGR